MPLPAPTDDDVTDVCARAARRILRLVDGFIPPTMLAGIGRARLVIAYHAIAAIVLPLSFIIAAEVAPVCNYVGVAWAWAIGDPIAFALLLAMALPAVPMPIGSYLRGLTGIVVYALGAAIAGVLVRVALPDQPWLRTTGTAPVILLVYGLLLWAIERVTLRSVLRSLRR